MGCAGRVLVSAACGRHRGYRTHLQPDLLLLDSARSACRLVSRKLRQRDSCLYPQCPGQFAGNPAVYAALLFLSASGDVVPGRGPSDGFLVMEAAAATLVNGPRFYGHGWPAEPRY